MIRTVTPRRAQELADYLTRASDAFAAHKARGNAERMAFHRGCYVGALYTLRVLCIHHHVDGEGRYHVQF